MLGWLLYLRVPAHFQGSAGGILGAERVCGIRVEGLVVVSQGRCSGAHGSELWDGMRDDVCGGGSIRCIGAVSVVCGGRSDSREGRGM